MRDANRQDAGADVRQLSLLGRPDAASKKAYSTPTISPMTSVQWLERYAREHRADTDARGIPERGIPSNPELRLLPVADFRTLLYRVAYKGRGLLVAFNFPSM